MLKYVPAALLLFLIGTETFLVSPLLPDILRQLAVKEGAGAWIVNAYVLVYAFSAPFLAPITDRKGPRFGLAAGAALFAAGNLLAAFAWSAPILVAARAIGGIGGALAGPAGWAYLAGVAGDAGRPRAMGIGMAAFSLGQVLGVPIAGVIASHHGWRLPFLFLSGGTLIALLIVVLSVRIIPGRRASAGVWAWLKAYPAVLLDRRVAWVVALTLVFQAVSLGSYAFLGIILDQRFKLDAGALGVSGILVGLGSIAGALLGRPLIRLIARTDGYAAGIPAWCCLMGGGLTLLLHAGSLAVAAAAIAVWFFASGAFVTGQQTLLANLVPDRRASASSWNTAFMHIGTALGVWFIAAFQKPGDGAQSLIVLGLPAAILISAWVARIGSTHWKRQAVSE